MDNHTVIRFRSEHNNLYQLDYEKYKSFNRGVPEPIGKLVNVCDTNFQGQMHLTFWFACSPSELARNLNQIFALDVIDTTLQEANRRDSEAQRAINVTKEELENHRDARDELSQIKEIDKKLTELEDLSRIVKEKEIQVKEIEAIVNEIDALKSYPSVEELESVLCQIKQIEDQEDILVEIVGAVAEAEEIQADLQKAETEIEQIQAELDDIETCPLCGSEME